MKVTLTQVLSKAKETKYGMKQSVGIKIQEETVLDINGETVEVNDRYLNGWFKEGYEPPFTIGDTIDIVVKQRGEWLDFSLPKAGESDNSTRILELEAEVGRLRKLLAAYEETEEEPPF